MTKNSTRNSRQELEFFFVLVATFSVTSFQQVNSLSWKFELYFHHETENENPTGYFVKKRDFRNNISIRFSSILSLYYTWLYESVRNLCLVTMLMCLRSQCMMGFEGSRSHSSEKFGLGTRISEAFGEVFRCFLPIFPSRRNLLANITSTWEVLPQGKLFRSENVAAIRKYRVAPALTSNLFNTNGASRLFRFLTNPREIKHVGLVAKYLCNI